MRYLVDNTSLAVTTVCPTVATSPSLPFTAVGTAGLALQVDAKHRQVYQRRP
jgi:hypothetical protein